MSLSTRAPWQEAGLTRLCGAVTGPLGWWSPPRSPRRGVGDAYSQRRRHGVRRPLQIRRRILRGGQRAEGPRPGPTSPSGAQDGDLGGGAQALGAESYQDAPPLHTRKRGAAFRDAGDHDTTQAPHGTKGSVSTAVRQRAVAGCSRPPRGNALKSPSRWRLPSAAARQALTWRALAPSAPRLPSAHRACGRNVLECATGIQGPRPGPTQATVARVANQARPGAHPWSHLGPR